MDDVTSIRVAAAILAAAAMLGLSVAYWQASRPVECAAQYAVQVVEREVQPQWVDATRVVSPAIDHLMPEDWLAHVEADSDCLWELLNAADVEITVDVVLAFGYWADVQGGPCLVAGRG